MLINTIQERAFSTNSRIVRFQDLASDDPAMQVPFQNVQTVYWSVASGEEMGIENSYPCPPPPPSSPAYRCIDDQLRHSSTQDLTMAGVWSQEELHISILKIKVVQLILNAFLPRVLGELAILMSDNASGNTSEEAIGHYFQGDVQSSTGDLVVVRTTLCDTFCKIHPQEEGRFGLWVNEASPSSWGISCWHFKPPSPHVRKFFGEWIYFGVGLLWHSETSFNASI